MAKWASAAEFRLNRAPSCEGHYAASNIAARHWQTDCMAEPTGKFENVMRRAPPTDKDALALEPVANSIVSGSSGVRAFPVAPSATPPARPPWRTWQ